MSLQNGTSGSTKAYSDRLRSAREALDRSERVLIGVGAGLSAAGGLNYGDPSLGQRWYPEYYALGKHSIIDIMRGFWPNTIDDRNAQRFWGFWARHIFHIRYEAPVLAPYAALFALMQGRDYFVISTNADGQMEKAGFPKERIFAPQGDYALLQCKTPCTQEVYDNRAMIDTMLANMPNAFEVRAEDVPRCPRCGAHLIPNLRADAAFVEKPHLTNLEAYQRFVEESQDKPLVLMELGVGFNTPVIIRFPFERIAAQSPKATLLRINREFAEVPDQLGDKAISFSEGAVEFLRDVQRRDAEGSRI